MITACGRDGDFLDSLSHSASGANALLVRAIRGVKQNEPMEDGSECLWKHAANLAVLAREWPAAPAIQEEDIELLLTMLEAQGHWAWNG